MPDSAKQNRELPQRMCVACRYKGTKDELIRLARTTQGRITLDLAGTCAGRGAYLCRNPACWNTAIKRRSLERALRLETLHPEDLANLKAFAQSLKQVTTV